MSSSLQRIADGCVCRREVLGFFGNRTGPLPLGVCSFKEEELQTFQVADAADKLHSWLTDSENWTAVKLIAGLPYSTPHATVVDAMR